MPVVSEEMQLVFPHLHAAELAADPSVTAQSGVPEQVLPKALQAWYGKQSTVPQAHATELAADPSVKVQGACLLHLFSDSLQNIPVEFADSQSTLPQAQTSEFATDPSDAEQVEILRHWFLLK
jgi:hypothetical protein